MNPKYDWGIIIHNIMVPTKKQQFKPIEGGEVEITHLNEDGTVEMVDRKKIYYADSDPKNIKFENHIRDSLKENENVEILKGMLELVIVVTDKQSRIKSIDVDNLSKSVMDALKGIIYQDDNQVYSLTVMKDSLPNLPSQSLMVAARKIKNLKDIAHPFTLFSVEEI